MWMVRGEVIFMIVVLSCIFIMGCGKPKLDSKWRDHEISIDGEQNDWQDAIAYYDEKTRVSVGIINDDTYLYVCLLSRNRSIMEQLMRQGLTVWFDPKGGADKVFGIHYPVRMQGHGMPMEEKGEDAMPPEQKGAGEMPGIFQGAEEEIEIIGPGKEERYTTSVKEAEKEGISVRIGKSKGYFVYELKVPLIENEQYGYAIGAKVHNPIGLGLETSGFNSRMMRRGSMPGGGREGRGMPGGGMPGGGRGGMPGGDMPAGNSGLKLWAIVSLSSK